MPELPSENADCTGCGGQGEYRRGVGGLPYPRVDLITFLKATIGQKEILTNPFFPNHDSDVSQDFTKCPSHQLFKSRSPNSLYKNRNSTCNIQPWCPLHWEFWAVWGRRVGSWRQRCWLRAGQRVHTHRLRAGIASRSARSAPGLCLRSLYNTLSYFSR